MKKIGIIGGSGAFATTHLLRKINEYSVVVNKSSKDEDFPYVVTLSSSMQGVDLRGNYNEKTLAVLMEDLHSLERLGCNIIIIACNVLNQFHDILVKEKLMKHTIIISLPSLVSSCFPSNMRNVVLLSSRGGFNSGIYQRAIMNKGINVTLPSEGHCVKLDQCIEQAISGRVNIKLFNEVLEEIIESPDFTNQTGIVLGCSELSLLRSGILPEYEDYIYDPIDIVGLYVNRVIGIERLISINGSNGVNKW
jgi:aspartate racemase